jgi:hypothetical protein
MEASKVETCECGLAWSLVKIKTIMRDSGSFQCICGKELIRWNGDHMWTGFVIPKQVKKQKQPPAGR